MAVSQRTDAEARAAEAHAGEAHAGGAPPITWRDKLQTFRTAAWLGWQAESNWTDPLLFAVYSLVKPLAAAMILVVIYRIVGSETADALFPGMYVGNALFMYVGALMFGVSWVVIEDREYYRTLKYIYVTSSGIMWYLAGRAVAKFLVTTIAVVVLFVFGRAFLGVPLSPASVDWGLLAAVFPLGLLTTVGLGLILAGIMLLAARHGEGYTESVAGALYLLCGVVFPLDVLPGWLQAAGKVIPLTYWIEGLRRAFLDQPFGSALASYSDGALLAVLAVSTAATMLVAVPFYRWMDRVARSRGLLDQLTEH